MLAITYKYSELHRIENINDLNLIEHEVELYDQDVNIHLHTIYIEQVALLAKEEKLDRISFQSPLNNDQLSYLSPNDVSRIRMEFYLRDATYNSDSIIPLEITNIEEEKISFKKVSLFIVIYKIYIY